MHKIVMAHILDLLECSMLCHTSFLDFKIDPKNKNLTQAEFHSARHKIQSLADPDCSVKRHREYTSIVYFYLTLGVPDFCDRSDKYYLQGEGKEEMEGARETVHRHIAIQVIRLHLLIIW